MDIKHRYDEVEESHDHDGGHPASADDQDVEAALLDDRLNLKPTATLSRLPSTLNLRVAASLA